MGERLLADVSFPVQHVLHLLKAGLGGHLEQLVDAHAEVGGDGRQQRDVGQAGVRLTQLRIWMSNVLVSVDFAYEAIVDVHFLLPAAGRVR